MSTLTTTPRTLADLRVGQSAEIDRISGQGPLRRRLLELGLLRGTPVRVVRIAPLGDPIQLEVRGGSLSIRHEDARSICLVCGAKREPE